ncbi:MAG TPA: hypothetical protein VGM90_17490 [Kofleriaceae bacterium]|jgi:hypothetical protein
MKTAARVTLALVLASASPVLAQDGAPSGQPPQPAPAAPVATVAQYPAPMTNAWSNVSHINGTVVPVGDKNNYLNEFKRTNISTNPIGWMAGVYGLSASYAVSENIVLKGDANIFNDFFGSDGYEVNATALLYLRRAYSGPYVEAGVMQRETHGHGSDNSTDCYDYGCDSMSTTQTGPEVLVGYTSMFDSGFNISYAFGLARDMNAKNYDGESSSSTEDQLTPTGYLRVGYAF